MADRQLPYYRWYVVDYRASRTYRELTWKERGVYRELLDECWTEGAIPDDPRQLAKLCEVPLGEMAEIWEVLRPHFQPSKDLPDPYLVHPRLEAERTEQDRLRLARKRGGLTRGAQIQGVKQAELKDTLRTPQAELKDTSGSNSNSISKSKSKDQKQNPPIVPPSGECVGGGVDAGSETGVSPVAAEDLIGFELFWTTYPKRPGASKPNSLKAWIARIKAGVPIDALVKGAQAYAAYVKAEGTEPRYIKQPETFLGPGKHYESDWRVKFKDRPYTHYSPNTVPPHLEEF
jgi:uncharacterized protein YdaU (DUF1376 family)